jgi:hypothetical protein
MAPMEPHAGHFYLEEGMEKKSYTEYRSGEPYHGRVEKRNG